MMTKQFAFALALPLTLILAGCQQAPPPAPKVDLKAEAAKISEADAAWLTAAQAKDAARHAAIFAEDGSWHPAGYPSATGRAAIQKLSEEINKSVVSTSWKTAKIVVADSADVAYQTGTWESTDKDAKGKTTKSVGKFVTVWKRQPDGNWKVQEDISNADGPPAPVK